MVFHSMFFSPRILTKLTSFSKSKIFAVNSAKSFQLNPSSSISLTHCSTFSSDLENPLCEMAGNTTMPAFYISHGGGPCFYMDGEGDPVFSHVDKHSEARKWYENFANLLPSRPKSILVISAHWETSEFRVITKPTPTLFYDYYGFPPETYNLQYPCPNSPELIQRIKTLMKEAGIKLEEDPDRGYDHGVFVPLKLMFPKADVPIVQLSLHSSLNPEIHYKLGQVLAPLRQEGVLIIGSGSTTHNLRSIGSLTSADWVMKWCDWLRDVLTNPDYDPQKRKDMLVNFKKQLFTRDAHPREEHFIPIFVALGSANTQPARRVYDKIIGSWSLESYLFS